MIELVENPVDYFTLPKAMGSVSPEMLLTLAEYHQSRGYDSLSPFTAARHKGIGGSTIIEAMLLYPDAGHEDDDYRLENLDIAEMMLQSAANDELAALERNLRKPNDIVPWLRASIATDFMEVYRDMVCGELSDLTVKTLREDLYKRLRDIAGYISDPSLESKFKSDLYGLQSELIVVADVWQKYIDRNDPIVVPSTYRGGSGTDRPSETHDLVFFKQKEDTTFEVLKNAEVKSEGSSTERRWRALGRYTCSLILVDRNGNIRTIE